MREREIMLEGGVADLATYSIMQILITIVSRGVDACK